MFGLSGLAKNLVGLINSASGSSGGVRGLLAGTSLIIWAF